MVGSLLLAGLLLSQTPAPTTPPPPAAPAAPPVAAAPATPPVPELTELERLRYETIALRSALAEATAKLQELQLAQQIAALEAAVAAAHPGYGLDRATGKLVAAPAPAKTETDK